MLRTRMRTLRIIALSLMMIFVLSGAAVGKKEKDKKVYTPKSIQVSELKERVGTKVTFVGMDEELARYDYQTIHERPGQIGGLPYSKYTGKNGTIKDVWKSKDGQKYYWIVVLDNDKKVYAEIDSVDLDYVAGMYSTKDMVSADALVGKDVWINQAEYKIEPQPLITKNPKVSFDITHLEKVRVLSVVPKIFGHGPARAKFYLKVKKKNNKEGLLGFRKYNFFTKDPINPNWPKETVDALYKKEVLLGMTMEQTIIAAGRPMDVKTIQKENETKVQWDFGGQILVFKNGLLWKIKQKGSR